MGHIELESMVLSDVANTGLLTTFCRAKESRSDRPLLSDPLAEDIADRLTPILARSPNKLQRRLAAGRIRSDMAVHIALRARKYDQFARDFVARHTDGCVVNLGCGLDTRFWRIDDGRLTQYDVDLPEMIDLKRQLVPESGRYHLVDQSVLDSPWRDRLATEQSGPFIFLAEGLFMYLPPDGVRALVLDLQSRFPGSELAFEAVNSKWLTPAMRWMVTIKMQKELGLGPGTEYQFGIRDAHEPETWRPGIRLLEEWFYLDEDEKKIGFRRRFRNWSLFRTTQWTVRYALEPAGSTPIGVS